MINLPRTPNPIGHAENSQQLHLPPHLLSKIFPFYLAFGQDMTLVQLGDAIQKLYPKITIGTPLKRHFRLQSPSLPLDFTAFSQYISEYTQADIILEIIHDSLSLMGKVLYSEALASFFFLGSPNITDGSLLTNIGQNFSSYVLQDSISDFLFLLEARSASLPDARRMAEKLTEQRAELHRALSQAELANAVLEQAADAIEITDADYRILYVNTAFEKITGYSREEALGKTPAMLFRAGQHEDAFYEDISRTIAAGQTWSGYYLSRRKDGSFYHQEATIFPVCDRRGEITNFVALKRDISDGKLTKTKLEHSISLLKATFEATADGILVTDIRGKILHFNQKFVDLWKVPDHLLATRSNRQVMRFIAEQLKNPRDFSTKKMLELYIRPHIEIHDVLELKDDRILERYSCPQRLDDVVIGWVWSFRDVTERKRNEARIRHQALHDSLTSLPNRVLFNEQLSESLLNAKHQKTQLAVLFLDLDRFKLINDTLGHAIGDRLLQAFAQRVKGCLRSNDMVARWAGDEFTLLLPHIHHIQEVIAIAQRILDTMKPDFDLEGHLLRVTSSIGIAIYPTDGEDAETLLKNADAALYRAKESGRNAYHIYTSSINSEAAKLLTLENQLHRALERQEFILHYQPQINTITGEIMQLEALLRWKHPEMGLVFPDRFMALVEETGLIVPIGEWVLRTACQQQRLWQKANHKPVRVAVNLSAYQFRQPRLTSLIKRILSETEVDPGYLELEITETTAMTNVEMTRDTLDELHNLGISIALDDFGTGYSSLSHLKQFPFHKLKIDRSFIRDLTTDPNDKAIVTAIIAMGKVLNLKLVAEGVETNLQKHLLRSLGCEEMQGYLFSPPMPADEIIKLIQNQAKGLSAFSHTPSELTPVAMKLD